MKDKKRRVHIMGIGGSGASSIARLAHGMGYEVSGCDLEEGVNTKALKVEGIPVSIGSHDVAHLEGIDILAHTVAVDDQSPNEPEYLEAKTRGIAMTWEQFLANYLHKGKFLIAVAGTHGKGTTASLLSRTLESAGLDPTCEIGANLLDWDKKNFRIGKSKYFVSEADEYRAKFLHYSPSLILITSIEMDHPDFFPTIDNLYETFLKFVGKLIGPKVLVLNKNDHGCQELVKRMPGELKNEIKIVWYSNLPEKVNLQLPGEHVRQDAAGAWAVAKELGVPDKEIKKGLESFSGLERRFEIRGEKDGVVIIDDYAHHPTAVKVNIDAVREKYPNSRVVALFQPHMYSRLQLLFQEFAKILRSADKVFITEVYTRREQGQTRPTGEELAAAIGARASFVKGSTEEIATAIKPELRQGDVLLVMGAGDIYKVSTSLLTVDVEETNIGANALLVNSKGEIILQQRDNNPNIYFPGGITMYGGTIKRGDSPEDGLRRELLEELNLQVEPGNIKKFNTYEKTKAVDGIDYIVNIFIVEPVEVGDLTLNEGAGFVVGHPIDLLKKDKLTRITRIALEDYLRAREQ